MLLGPLSLWSSEPQSGAKSGNSGRLTNKTDCSDVYGTLVKKQQCTNIFGSSLPFRLYRVTDSLKTAVCHADLKTLRVKIATVVRKASHMGAIDSFILCS